MFFQRCVNLVRRFVNAMKRKYTVIKRCIYEEALKRLHNSPRYRLKVLEKQLRLLKASLNSQTRLLKQCIKDRDRLRRGHKNFCLRHAWILERIKLCELALHEDRMMLRHCQQKIREIQ
jgi:hypothetical protein